MQGEQNSVEETRLYRERKTLSKSILLEIFELLECNHWMDHADSHTVSNLMGIRKYPKIGMPQAID